MAFGSRVSGIRMLDGSVTDILEAQSFVYKAHVNHVYSCSWGPEDNGHTIEGPGKLAQVSTNWNKHFLIKHNYENILNYNMQIMIINHMLHVFICYRRHCTLVRILVAMVTVACMCLPLVTEGQ